jgi:hypothetical protein
MKKEKADLKCCRDSGGVAKFREEEFQRWADSWAEGLALFTPVPNTRHARAVDWQQDSSENVLFT